MYSAFLTIFNPYCMFSIALHFQSILFQGTVEGDLYTSKFQFLNFYCREWKLSVHYDILEMIFISIEPFNNAYCV